MKPEYQIPTAGHNPPFVGTNRNLLVNSNCDLKICDYGLARVNYPQQVCFMVKGTVRGNSKREVNRNKRRKTNVNRK